jgi:hypothetical protein
MHRKLARSEEVRDARAEKPREIERRDARHEDAVDVTVRDVEAEGD